MQPTAYVGKAALGCPSRAKPGRILGITELDLPPPASTAI
jgi:hypothetical protein